MSKLQDLLKEEAKLAQELELLSGVYEGVVDKGELLVLNGMRVEPSRDDVFANKLINLLEEEYLNRIARHEKAATKLEALETLLEG